MASSVCGLQHSPDWLAAGMRIGTSKSEAVVLNKKAVDCPLRVGNESLAQVKVFGCLGILFTSEGTIKREICWRIGAAGAVLRKAKLSIYRFFLLPSDVLRLSEKR